MRCLLGLLTVVLVGFGSALNAQEGAMSEKPDPKELAASLQAASELDDERQEKLSPFKDAGWTTNKKDVAFRQLGGYRLSANYNDGQFQLFFFGVAKTILFNSAKEALEYVGEVEKQLGGK